MGDKNPKKLMKKKKIVEKPTAQPMASIETSSSNRPQK